MQVLLVDDDATVRRAIARLLPRALIVDEAGGARDAAEKLKASTYDAVLTDEEMPDGSGCALLALVAAEQPSCARLLMSGKEPPTMEDGRCPWHEFFAKPQDLQTMVAWFRRQLALRG